MWNPTFYHGWGKKKKYFEGWYYKMIDHTKQHALAVIPGVSMDEKGKQEAFIQVLDDVHQKSHFHKFDFSDFIAEADRFEVRIKNNFFSTHRIDLDLDGLKGSLEIDQIIPWPKSSWAPGIMGWYSFVPFMQCYHGIVSMNHTLTGSLQLEDKQIEFNEGKGYIEKDWGRSFPSAWIWMQSNHFNTDQTCSLVASTAHIPWMGQYFVGFIVGFYFEGELIQFATYLNSRIKTSVDGNLVQLSLKNKRYQLEIVCEKEAGEDLVSPISGEMAGKVNESIRSFCQVKLLENGTLKAELESPRCALEVAGNIEVLLSNDWKK